MYESPIKILHNAMMRDYEEGVAKAVLHYDIQVDKDELIRALAYDRQQYEKGYADGRAAADELVRCSECVHDDTTACPLCWIENHTMQFINHDADFYCGKGERRSDD